MSISRHPLRNATAKDTYHETSVDRNSFYSTRLMMMMFVFPLVTIT